MEEQFVATGLQGTLRVFDSRDGRSTHLGRHGGRVQGGSFGGPPCDWHAVASGADFPVATWGSGTLIHGRAVASRLSLSTLRSPGHPGTTQDSLPAAGLLGRAGLVTRRVPMKGFCFRVLLSQAFLAH